MGSKQISIKDKLTNQLNKLLSGAKKLLVDDEAPAAEYRRTGTIPTLQALKDFTDRHVLADILPYKEYDAEDGIYYNIDTTGFMVYAYPATSLTAGELRTINGFFNQSHNSEATIQVTLVSDPNIEPSLDAWAETKGQANNKNIRNIFKDIANNRVKYLTGGKWHSLLSQQAVIVKNYHLIISYTINNPVGQDSIDEQQIEALKRKREALIGTLKSAGVGAVNLDPKPFINILNPIINPTEDRSVELDYDENNFISSQIVDADTLSLFGSGLSSFIHQDKDFSVIPFHVRQFPKRWAGYNNADLLGSFTNNILRLPCHFIMTSTINVPDQVAEKSRVTGKALRATQMSTSPMGKYVPAWADRKRDWDYVKEKVDDGNKLLSGFFQIILITPAGKEQECEQALNSVYNSMGWWLSRSRYMPIHSLLGALPMGVDQETKAGLKKFGHYRSRLSWNCTNTSPLVGEWRGTGTPLMQFISRRGQLIYFDPFDNKKGNYNVSISATSGSGKSFLTQEWIFSCLGMGGRAFVIDAGHSYKNLCSLVSGSYIDFGEGRPVINPFTHVFSDENMAKVDELAKLNPLEYSRQDYINDTMPLLKLLLSVMASPNEELTPVFSSSLEIAINSAINKYHGKTTITNVSEECLLQKDDNGETVSHAKELALMLHSYTKNGMYGRYFEGDNNIDLENPFVVLELDALNAKGDLQPIVLLILMMQISQIMYLSGNKQQRKLCIIDEAWRLMGTGRSGKFIEEGYRVARKHGGSFATVTQKISDYYSSDTSKAAYANSDFKLYLRQDPAELSSAEAKGHVDNSGGKVDLIKSLETIQGQYSEIAIDSPSGMSVVRFMVDPVTEKVYSTSPTEVQFIRDKVAAGTSILDAVDELIGQQGNQR